MKQYQSDSISQGIRRSVAADLAKLSRRNGMGNAQVRKLVRHLVTVSGRQCAIAYETHKK